MKNLEYGRQSGDWWIVIITGALVLIGFVMLSSATSAYAYRKFNADSYYFVKTHAIHILIGIVALWYMAKVDYHAWRPWAWYFWLFSLLLLVGVFIPGIGAIRNGVRGWIEIGGLSFQPVEVIKILFTIYLATWMAERSQNDLLDWRKGFVPFIFISGLFLLLIVLQPDLGSMILVGLIAVTIFIAGGASIKQQLAILGMGIFVIPFLIISRAESLERLTSFLHPGTDVTGIGYHLQQALIAIGSGGMWGRGFGKSVQKFYYLPEVAGDSIFAVIAEELGFVFMVFLLFLFMALLYRGLKAASLSRDTYGKLLATGITCWIMWQAFLNIGSIIGLLPLTGLPLPFISQGGTALISSLAAIGILFNISKQGIVR